MTETNENTRTEDFIARSADSLAEVGHDFDADGVMLWVVVGYRATSEDRYDLMLRSNAPGEFAVAAPVATEILRRAYVSMTQVETGDGVVSDAEAPEG